MVSAKSNLSEYYLGYFALPESYHYFDAPQCNPRLMQGQLAQHYKMVWQFIWIGGTWWEMFG